MAKPLNFFMPFKRSAGESSYDSTLIARVMPYRKMLNIKQKKFLGSVNA